MIRVAYITVATCFLIGCEQGPEPAKESPAAFLWTAARENYAKGDFVKTQEQLSKLMKLESEYAVKARPWNLVLLSGMAKGYMELGNSFETGGRQNKNNPAPFRKATSDYRSMASRYATQFAEDFAKFAKARKEGDVPLHFASPGGTAARHPLLDKAASGIQPSAGDLESAQRDVVRRAVLLAACHAAGAPNDAARLSEILKGESANVNREVFQRAMAESLYDQSDLFEKRKLGRPDHQKFFLSQAQEALKSVPEDKDAKELKKKIEGGLKGL